MPGIVQLARQSAQAVEVFHLAKPFHNYVIENSPKKYKLLFVAILCVDATWSFRFGTFIISILYRSTVLHSHDDGRRRS